MRNLRAQRSELVCGESLSSSPFVCSNGFPMDFLLLNILECTDLNSFMSISGGDRRVSSGKQHNFMAKILTLSGGTARRNFIYLTGQWQSETWEIFGRQVSEGSGAFDTNEHLRDFCRDLVQGSCNGWNREQSSRYRRGHKRTLLHLASDSFFLRAKVRDGGKFYLGSHPLTRDWMLFCRGLCWYSNQLDP